MSKLHRIQIGPRICIDIFFLVLVAAAFLGNYLALFTISYLSALLHEMGHIGIAKILKVRISKIEIHPFGISGKLKDNYIKNPELEILISLAGPIISLIVSLIALLCRQNQIFNLEYINYVMNINMALFLINLLPSMPLDGGRILKSIVCMHYGAIKAYNFINKLSQLIVSIILILSAILLLTTKFNFSMLLIGIFLLGNITNEQKAINIMAMKEIIYNKEKLFKNNINRIKPIAVYETLPARIVLKNLSYNYYYIINILNSKSEVVSVITETQVIDAIIKKGIRVKIGNIPGCV